MSQKQHLDRDLAMGWLIRQDAPQAKEIRDYIDRLRILVRERNSLEEHLEAAEESVDRWKGWYEERQRQFVELQGWIDEYERFLASMPDADLSADDPRWSWYMARPKYPDFRSTWRAVRAHDHESPQ